MSRILVVGEDALCCALGERLVAELLDGWTLAQPVINTGGVTNLVPSLPRYNQQAQHVQPVLCIADTDGKCAASLSSDWLPRQSSNRLLLRLAVTEAESWILADDTRFASHFAVNATRIPERPDELSDPKRLILQLALRSGKRVLREEMVSSIDTSKKGSGYNLHLAQFVRTRWRAKLAARRSPSLARAIERIQQLPSMIDAC